MQKVTIVTIIIILILIVFNSCNRGKKKDEEQFEIIEHTQKVIGKIKNKKCIVLFSDNFLINRKNQEIRLYFPDNKDYGFCEWPSANLDKLFDLKRKMGKNEKIVMDVNCVIMHGTRPLSKVFGPFRNNHVLNFDIITENIKDSIEVDYDYYINKKSEYYLESFYYWK